MLGHNCFRQQGCKTQHTEPKPPRGWDLEPRAAVAVTAGN